MWSFLFALFLLVAAELLVVPRLPLWLGAHLFPLWLGAESFRRRPGSVLLGAAAAGAVWDIVWAAPWPRFWLGSVLAAGFLLWSDYAWKGGGWWREVLKWLLVNAVILLFFDGGNLIVLALRAPATLTASWLGWQLRLFRRPLFPRLEVWSR